jgi:predicted small lipoprotein YifL
MKRIAFLALFLNIAACGAKPTTVPEINVKTAATAVQISGDNSDSDNTSGDTNVSHDTDTTGAEQSIQVDLPADGKAPTVNVTVTPAAREDRKPDTK